MSNVATQPQADMDEQQRNLQPLFIFSLPRTGSTLLQRMLATQPAIATVAEPYILLPLIYARREHGAYAEYSHGLVSIGINDFVRSLPNGSADYDDSAREFIMSLYKKANSDPQTVYFLDKSPSYCMIASDIIKLFPEGKFIFLWRNPLSVIASTITSLPHYGHWNLYNKWDTYLHDGQAELLDAYNQFEDRAIAIQYEKLLTEPEGELEKICDYLGLPFSAEMTTNFSNVDLKSWNFGDQSGQKSYKKLSHAPLTKWKKELAGPLRKRWVRRYIKWVGAPRLARMGYDLSTLLNDLDNAPSQWRTTPADAWWMAFGAGYKLFEYRLLRHKLRRVRSGRRVSIHT